MPPNAMEQRVWRALRDQAEPGEVILQSVRFTDAKGGDVEADLLVLIPGLGAAVIEVKGGQVEHRNGEWTTTNRKGSSRRIHPIDQARRGKHALRRFLDRQAEWNHGLLRSAWFVAMPQTTVGADLGPEAPRAHVLDRNDLSSAMVRIRTVLGNSLDPEPVPEGEWVDDAVSLLMRLPPSEPAATESRVTWRSVLAGIGALLVSAGLVIGLGWWGLAATVLLAGVVGGWYLWRGQAQAGLGVLLSAATIGLGVGVFSGVGWNMTLGKAECAPGYEPCLPVRDDIDCSQIDGPVRITGDDQYDLDRNGDGIGCETPTDR